MNALHYLNLTWLFVVGTFPVYSQNAAVKETSPDKVVAMNSSERTNFLSIYEHDKKLWAPKELLPIAIAYAMEGEVEKSETAYLSYLKVSPKDGRANRGIGFVYLSKDLYDKAIKYFEIAWKSGDQRSLRPLAATYMAAGKERKIGPLVPDLIRYKANTKGEDRLEAVKLVIYYAVKSKPFQRDAFLEAMEGMSDDEFLGDKGIVPSVIEGLKLSGDEKRSVALAKRFEGKDH